MGALFSLFKSRTENDYEKILAELEDKIQKVEIRLSDIKVRERKFVLIFLIYSLFAYGLYLVTYFVYLRDPEDEFYTWFWKLIPAFVSPPVIYFVSRGVSFWYTRKRINEETHLENLKTKQRQKVEELKKKTAYYSTKNLLDRYDTPNKPKSGKPLEGVKTPIQPNIPARLQGKLVAPNSAPVNPGMRQRHVVGKAQDIKDVNTPNPALSSRNLQDGTSQSSKMPLVNAVSTIPPNNPTNGVAPPQIPQNRMTNQQSNWYDKIIDVIVGEEGPNTKYALICKNCFAHNGLALPNEIDDIQYYCPKCNAFNPSRRPRPKPQSNQTPMNKPTKPRLQDNKISKQEEAAGTMTPTPAEKPAKLKNGPSQPSKNEDISSSEDVVEESPESEIEELEFSEAEPEEYNVTESSNEDKHSTASSDEAETPVEPVRETVLKNNTKKTPLRQRNTKSKGKN
ncbi:hypothetical protein K493DRAFT_332877 [Basidiobolus meristosporus CBS 931.73]|uniref:Endoplasmic reticulum junction formation protein lunapark n=1 Tax=Basidiobolus meristosporus CBS 931.73 TaxID=1314790 RepID=A0A1Y1ZA04_9FUNG|nr:hypothetical protein K493DRAFT_332877 [Basidiobolus meristosporus CBS 931.73]|eukprot:ORY07089.1 hypothetical protein K493DRAFT_332877 [Basidiobolus meristosporus CBS 931.73]